MAIVEEIPLLGTWGFIQIIIAVRGYVIITKDSYRYTHNGRKHILWYVNISAWSARVYTQSLMVLH